MPVFVNRVLNLKKIKVIGFDMDYTLVRYKTDAFEELSHRLAARRLVDGFGYPPRTADLKFDGKRSIVGLVLDKRHGNLLQLSRYGKVKAAYHGLNEIDFRTRSRIYRETAIDFSDPGFESLDTSFAISYGVLYAQLVQLKEDGEELPDFRRLAEDVHSAVDLIHKDGSLKGILMKNFDKYVIRDPRVPQLLERYLGYQKRLMIITNSDYSYTRALLDYALNPYWKKHKSWQEVFELVVTLSDKPRFFERPGRFLRIDPETGCMTNHLGPLESGGIYQGGWFRKIQQDLGVAGSEILYLGDHIYGDVVSIKKQCDWRTALVLWDLEREREGLRLSRKVQSEIDGLMEQKGELEARINELDVLKYEGRDIPGWGKEINALYEEMDGLNNRISALIGEYKSYFNPYWGEILRAGNEESRFAEQVERYACIYMTKVSDLYDYSPKTYFRPLKRVLPHERDI